MSMGMGRFVKAWKVYQDGYKKGYMTIIARLGDCVAIKIFMLMPQYIAASNFDSI
jgi:hypothetical protein